MNVMNEMVGYCGYNCRVCAARSDDPSLREELVAGWRKLYGHQDYTAENVHCCGCRGEGEVADKQCRARPCARERGLASCADCEEFPCDKLKELISPIFFATDREYDLCMRQFHGAPNLIRRLQLRRRLPSRLEQYADEFRDCLGEMEK